VKDSHNAPLSVPLGGDVAVNKVVVQAVNSVEVTLLSDRLLERSVLSTVGGRVLERPQLSWKQCEKLEIN
jgi:hypothetical protein